MKRPGHKTWKMWFGFMLAVFFIPDVKYIQKISEAMPSELVTVKVTEPKILEAPDDKAARKGSKGTISSLLVSSFVTGNVSWAEAQQILPCDGDLGCQMIDFVYS